MDPGSHPATFIKLASPLEAAAFVPTSEGDGRPCTRAQSGAAPVAYAQMEDGGPAASDDSGAASGGDTVHLPDEQHPLSESQYLGLDGGKGKKKVGRPITYRGDVNSKDLTEAERRRIKRRVANRESARRVRQKRQETMAEMQQRMEAMKGQITALSTHLNDVELQKTSLLKQLENMRSKWSHAINENARLQGEGMTVFESTTSSPSSNTDADLHVPSVSSIATLPAPTSQHASQRLVQLPHMGTTGGAITSGATLQLGSVPAAVAPAAAAATTVVPSYRPGVTITSAVGGFGDSDGGRLQTQGLASPMPYAAAGAFAPQYQPQYNYQQQPTYQVQQQTQLVQQQAEPLPPTRAEVPKMTTASSLGEPLNWFLNQSTLEPLPSLDWDELKGI